MTHYSTAPIFEKEMDVYFVLGKATGINAGEISEIAEGLELLGLPAMVHQGHLMASGTVMEWEKKQDDMAALFQGHMGEGGEVRLAYVPIGVRKTGTIVITKKGKQEFKGTRGMSVSKEDVLDMAGAEGWGGGSFERKKHDPVFRQRRRIKGGRGG
ncbi:MAG: hypothetical protein KKA28_18780 [Planctomycetes bacterium]|nr:hypothetical protein [Planctomycetota bacterium]